MARSALRPWHGLGPAAFAASELAAKRSLKSLHKGQVCSGAASRHMNFQALVLLGHPLPQEPTPVAHDLHHLLIRVQGIGFAAAQV